MADGLNANWLIPGHMPHLARALAGEQVGLQGTRSDGIDAIDLDLLRQHGLTPDQRHRLDLAEQVLTSQKASNGRISGETCVS